MNLKWLWLTIWNNRVLILAAVFAVTLALILFALVQAAKPNKPDLIPETPFARSKNAAGRFHPHN